MPKSTKAKQEKFTLPEPDRALIKEAMEWDGTDNLSAFMLASARRNARRILREKQRTLSAEEEAFSPKHRPPPAGIS